MSECWIKVFGVHSWLNPDVWSMFFANMEEILQAKLTHLDDKDPPRYKISRDELNSVGNRVVAFGGSESSRWMFGRFARAKVDVTIHHHKTLRISDRDFPNSISIFFPEDFIFKDDGARKVSAIFDMCVANSHPFYAFSDLREKIIVRKRPNGAVNIQEELLGVFWLTFFGKEYVDFFGAKKMFSIKEVYSFLDGAMLRMGPTPRDSTDSAKLAIEEYLGSMSFVNPNDSQLKLPGRHALAFDRLCGTNMPTGQADRRNIE